MITITVSDITTIKPGIIRADVYTTRVTDTERIFMHAYQFAINVKDIIETQSADEVQLNIDNLMHLITERINEAMDTADLVNALKNINLEWEVEESENNARENTPKLDGMDLAYGENTE